MRILILFSVGLVLGGCQTMAETHKNIALEQGPAPEVYESPARPVLSCVRTAIKKRRIGESYGIISAPDGTGRTNINAHVGYGFIHTQAGPEILVGPLRATGVTVVDASIDFRKYLDWELPKDSMGLYSDLKLRSVTDEKTKETREIKYVPLERGSFLAMKYGVFGSISTSDPISGGGASAGLGGFGFSTEQNRTVKSVDVRITKMRPDTVGSRPAGTIVANVTIKKQAVTGGFRLEGTRFIGDANPVFATFSIGSLYREAQQLSDREMLELAMAYAIAEVYKIRGCGGEERQPFAVAAKG